jgi:hypothetical protein
MSHNRPRFCPERECQSLRRAIGTFLNHRKINFCSGSDFARDDAAEDEFVIFVIGERPAGPYDVLHSLRRGYRVESTLKNGSPEQI